MSDDTRVSALSLVNSSSICAWRWLFQFKLVHQTHISEAELSSMCPIQLAHCVVDVMVTLYNKLHKIVLRYKGTTYEVMGNEPGTNG